MMTMMMMRMAALHSQRGAAGNRWGETQTRPRHSKPDTAEHNDASGDDDEDAYLFDANDNDHDVYSGEVEIHKTQVNI